MSSNILISTTILLFMLHHQIYSLDLKVYNDMLGVYFGNHFYTWNDTRLTWLGAKRECHKQGGYLAVLAGEKINNFIFRKFFQQSVLMADSYTQNTLFNISRMEPPSEHYTSEMYHKDEAWVNGMRTEVKSGELQWVQLGGKPLLYNNSGTGFNSKGWNCLSVKPGQVSFSEYHLFWYGTDCFTPLPFICQFHTSKETSARSNRILPSDETENGAHTDTSCLNHGLFLLAIINIVFLG